MPRPANLAAQASISARHHVLALDGLRGLAVLMVVFYHTTIWAAVVTGRDALSGWGNAGHVGVDLFFVLSGFLITGILDATRDSRSYLKNFYTRRALRIFPLYYAVVLCAAVIAPLCFPGDPKLQELSKHQFWLWSYTSNVAVTLKNEWTFNILNHVWSLAVEEQFYLVWPLVVLHTTRTNLLKICVIAAGLALACRLYLTVFSPHHEIGTYVLTPCRMDSLLLGAWLALSRAESQQVGGAREPWIVRTATLFAPPAVALLACVEHFTGALDSSAAALFREAILPSFWALAFAGLLAAALNSGWLRWLLEQPALRFFGRYSYGIYVFHFPLHNVFERLVPLTSFRNGVLGWFVFFAVALTVTLLVAMLSFKWFETPFLAYKERFAAQDTARALDEAGAATPSSLAKAEIS